jgi:hypothetical protein
MGHHVTVFHRGRHEVDLPGGVSHIHGNLADLPPELQRRRRMWWSIYGR